MSRSLHIGLLAMAVAASASLGAVGVTLQDADPTTLVVVVHGFGQTADDVQALAGRLANRLDPNSFVVDGGFQWDCASDSCGRKKSRISTGARELAKWTRSRTRAIGAERVVFVGYSLGGILARHVLAFDLRGLREKTSHLVTLGSPNLGYAYCTQDSAAGGVLGANGHIARAIASHLAPDRDGSITLSAYLTSLNSRWSSVESGLPPWMAVAGSACSSEIRQLPSACTWAEERPTMPQGCPSGSSDGVVCQGSALFSGELGFGNGPQSRTEWPRYRHTEGRRPSLLCGFENLRGFALVDPAPMVLRSVEEFITG